VVIPVTGKTPLRAVRVSDALWQAAQVKARERGEDVSVVIRRALERYVKRKDKS
jgi:predicted transcriptional regulator